jgi:hypothetical protein
MNLSRIALATLGGLAAMFVSILALAVMNAMLYQGNSRVAEGGRLRCHLQRIDRILRGRLLHRPQLRQPEDCI